MDEQCSKQNFINSVFTLTGIVTIGAVLSTIVIGYYCYSPNKEEEEDEEVDEIEEYYGNFFDELDKLGERDLSDDELKKLEETYFKADSPQGEIIMSYNHENESYWYYADKTEISFKTLEAVARQYCIDNDCKSVYIDSKKEQNKKDENENKKDENESKKDENENSNVFVEFQKYKSTKNVYVMKANRFTKKGRIEEWNKIEDKKKVKETRDNFTKSLDFNMFKKMSGTSYN